MKLLQLLQGVTTEQPFDGGIEITSLAFDSRKAGPGCLFACLVGTQADGHDYAAAAAGQGAAALIVQRPLPIDVPQVLVADTREAFAAVCAHFFGDPADRLMALGVTGTNGKTTTTYMLHTVLHALGRKTGLIGTVGVLSGEEQLGDSMTTPEPLTLQHLLRRMADDGCEAVCMEVSSHALTQHRVAGLRFAVGIFTNLTQDHLDYHGTMERYLEAKRRLFFQCETGVFNADDPCVAAMMDGVPCRVLTYGVTHAADVMARDIDSGAQGIHYTLCYQGQERRVEMHIPGMFTVYNSLGCAAACLALGLPLDAVVAGLHEMHTVPGRIERVPIGDAPYTVILDYAHTPDGLINILSAVRGFAENRIIAVFGCGGDRDPQKRPLMGEAAGEGADYCIVTSDNPRTEDPQAIIEAILPGVQRSGCPYEVVADRRKAIKRALICAQPGDVVVLAGKGHEPYQEIHGVRHPFDEKEIVRLALEEIRTQA